MTEAWVDATEDAGEVEVKGTYQDSDVFWERVHLKFAAKAPASAPKGQYKDRQVSAITNQWKDTIAREVKKFNKALLKVFNSKPTGCNEQNQVNMAVAIHLGKTSTMSYVHKEFEANDWNLYQCWKILKSHRAFLPPPVPTMENTVDMDDDGSTISSSAGSISNTSNDVESTKTNSTKSTSNTAKAVLPKTATAILPKKTKSRGPGPGAKKTKTDAAADEYKKKKAKIQEGILEVQRERQKDFKTYIKNHARTKAFEMAALGYNTFKDSDPEEANKYKFHMKNILQGNTDADADSDEEEMPPLQV